MYKKYEGKITITFVSSYQFNALPLFYNNIYVTL